jgi:HAD superfamily hydrolase (TIGR01458 family)
MEADGFHRDERIHPGCIRRNPRLRFGAADARLQGMDALRGIKGLVVDLDGTLYVGDEVLPGVKEALAELRAKGMPMRFLTNTTSKPRSAIVAKLDGMGLGIERDSIFTAPRVAAAVLRERGLERAYFLLKDAVLADMEGIESVEQGAQAVVVGDMGESFTYDRLNRAFRLLLDGAEFYALAENRMYRHTDGMRLDVGAFVRALEYATRREAVLLGKPARAFFEVAVEALGLAPHEVASIGDDLEGDVGGGQGAGLKGVLVRTGKFREDELRGSAIRPDVVIDSFADVPALLADVL